MQGERGQRKDHAAGNRHRNVQTVQQRHRAFEAAAQPDSQTGESEDLGRVEFPEHEWRGARSSAYSGAVRARGADLKARKTCLTFTTAAPYSNPQMLLKLAPALALAGLSLCAQDTRHVTEPRIPPSCTVLTARLSAPNGALAAADERKPDTARIQSAIDQCRDGQAVELKSAGGRNIFLAGPLTLKAGVTLLVDGGAALFASRNPRDYDLTPGSCGVVNQRGHGCKTFLTADHATGGGIMGDGAIDGRGGAQLLGQNVTWWDLAKRAKVLDQSQSVPRLIAIRQSDNFTMYRITLRNSPNFHVGVDRTNGFTAWGVKIQTPKTARNTDGIDPSSSTNVTIAYCEITTGDDDVAIKTGASGPSTHMTIAHNHFYSGHGMSIGSGTSGGVSAIRVSDLTLDGTDYGIRIKSDRSRGGLVEDVSYENVCMRDVPNPMLLTSMYTTFPGEKLPVYRNILLKNVHSVTPGWITFLGLDEAHKLGATLDDVTVQGLRAAQVRIENAELSGAVRDAPATCKFPRLPVRSQRARRGRDRARGGQDFVRGGLRDGRVLLHPAGH